MLESAVDRINHEIVEATKMPAEQDDFINWPEVQRIHVTRWNAMREVLDGMRAFVDETRAERDRILGEREIEEMYARNS